MDLPVIRAWLNNEVVLKMIAVAIEDGINARVQIGVDNLCVVRNMGAPLGRIVPKQVVGQALLEIGTPRNGASSAIKIDSKATGLFAP